MDRRKFLKSGAVAGGALAAPGILRFSPAAAIPLALGLSDPRLQPKFVELAPNALDPAFLFNDLNIDGAPAWRPNFRIRVRETRQETGLIDPASGRRLKTRVWGYGARTISWPGQTVQVMNHSAGGTPETVIRWENELYGKKHLLPVDESLHWCYSLHGASSANGMDYRQYSIAKDGVPIVPHLHGGRTDFRFDGNPEFFFSPDNEVKGPQWDYVEGGFTSSFRYDNTVPAGNLWYHDHALGITRLNVYAGLAGFYFVRDEFDTGMPGNPLGLPAFPYELAYAVQDRMFTDRGELFYSAFPGDPFYDDFITGEGVILPPDLFPKGGPTALAEFFGDHMVVNGKIWPKENVEPRNYRMRLLNGCDSRFMRIQFRAVGPGETTLPEDGWPIPFWVIGADQGLGTPREVNELVFEPGARYDVVFNFAQVPEGTRVIMANRAGDAPFDGSPHDPDPSDLFPDRQTDRIMAFDVVKPLDNSVPDAFDPIALPVYEGNQVQNPTRRRVALFEGTDEFGRLQPLLGTVGAVGAEPGAIDSEDGTVTPYTWFQPTTETPSIGDTEVWEVYNFTGDAHPIHLHLVNFEVRGRTEFSYNNLGTQPVLQHNGTTGEALKADQITLGAPVPDDPTYYTTAPRDMVTALPEQVTYIKTTFEKTGRYVWHCHILSHEDHEMMRVLQVG